MAGVTSSARNFVMRPPSLSVSTVVAVVPTSRPEAEMSIDTFAAAATALCAALMAVTPPAVIALSGAEVVSTVTEPVEAAGASLAAKAGRAPAVVVAAPITRPRPRRADVTGR